MSALKGGKKSFDEFNLSANQSTNVPCGPVTTLSSQLIAWE